MVLLVRIKAVDILGMVELWTRRLCAEAHAKSILAAKAAKKMAKYYCHASVC